MVLPHRSTRTTWGTFGLTRSEMPKDPSRRWAGIGLWAIDTALLCLLVLFALWLVRQV